MHKNTVLILLIAGLLIIVGVFFTSKNPKNPLSSPKLSLIQAPKETKPSDTFIDYADPSGFGFSYPDNLSISKAEETDANTYTDLQIYSKDISGSLSLRIVDSKYNSLDEWLKANQIASSNTPKDVMFGNIKAKEVKTSDRLLMGALDQGVLFTLESPLIEQDFWGKVYDKVRTDFTFAPPSADTSSGSSNSSPDEVSFEGEEVVE